MDPAQLSVFARRGVHFRLFLDVPEKPGDVAKRHHNAWVKQAMREVLQFHHDHHIPQHYKGQESARKYRYAPRGPGYTKAKRRKYHHDYPLVYTGATAKLHKSPTGFKAMRIGGAAMGGKRPISGVLEYVFSFTSKIVEHFRAKFGGKTGKPQSQAAQQRQEQRDARRKMLREDARRRGVTIGQMRKELEQMTQQEVTKLAQVFAASYARQYNEFKSKRRRTRLPST